MSSVYSGRWMKAKGKSFYVFCAMAVVVVAVVIWGIASLSGGGVSSSERVVERSEELRPSAPQVRASSERVAVATALNRGMDDTKLVESLQAGALPTQEMGEHGSLEGAVVTRTPMKLTESNYRYLPDSPLLEFTDDMIWKSGEDTYTIKKDAAQIQARHIQEASIALSVSPRVEWEKTTGYRLVEIPEKSLFSKLGMVSGDIIVSINGATPDMEPMALMFVNMVAGSRGASTIVVEHRGVKRTLELRATE